MKIAGCFVHAAPRTKIITKYKSRGLPESRYRKKKNALHRRNAKVGISSITCRPHSAMIGVPTNTSALEKAAIQPTQRRVRKYAPNAVARKKILTVNWAVTWDTPNRPKNAASTKANSGGYVRAVTAGY